MMPRKMASGGIAPPVRSLETPVLVFPPPTPNQSTVADAPPGTRGEGRLCSMASMASIVSLIAWSGFDDVAPARCPTSLLTEAEDVEDSHSEEWWCVRDGIDDGELSAAALELRWTCSSDDSMDRRRSEISRRLCLSRISPQSSRCARRGLTAQTSPGLQSYWLASAAERRSEPSDGKLPQAWRQLVRSREGIRIRARIFGRTASDAGVSMPRRIQTRDAQLATTAGDPGRTITSLCLPKKRQLGLVTAGVARLLLPGLRPTWGSPKSQCARTVPTGESGCIYRGDRLP